MRLRSRFPESTSWTVVLNRSHAGRFISSVRYRSVNENVSTTVPPALEKAPAFPMFMPQAASVPATVEKRRGRSLVTTVSSYQWRGAFHRQLNWVLAEAARHLEVSQNFVNGMRAKISPRQTFQTRLELLARRGG